MFSSTPNFLILLLTLVFAAFTKTNIDDVLIRGAFKRYLSDIMYPSTISSFPQKYVVSRHSLNTFIDNNQTHNIRFYHDEELQKLGKPEEIKWTKMSLYLNASYMHLANVFVNFAGSVITQENEFVDYGKGNGPDWIHNHKNGAVIGEEESVISLGHDHMRCFSHFFYDFLAPLTMIPMDIVDKSVVLVDKLRQYQIDGFAAFNITRDRIIVAKNNYIFAKNSYIAVNPSPHVAHYGTAILNLSRIFANYYQLDKIPANRYLFCNRNTKSRHIHNMKKLVKAANNHFSEHFEEIKDFFSIKETAISWTSAKLMCAPTGSNMIKAIFMKKDSVCVIICSRAFDLSFAHAGTAVGIYFLYYINMQMGHGEVTYNIIDVDRTMVALKLGIECTKLGHWGDDKSFYKDSSFYPK